MNPADGLKVLLVLLCANLLLFPYGCGDEVEINDTQDAVVCEWAQAMSEATQDKTPWPVMGTVSKPSFGKGCRYGVESNHELASNCEKDDYISLQGPPDGVVTVDMTIRHQDSDVLEFSVELQRSLVGKAYDSATGTGAWHGDDGFSGEVLDGTLCFSDKLALGTPVSGEFSLVIEDAAGIPHSVGGRFVLDGQELSGESPLSLTSTTVDLDLR